METTNADAAFTELVKQRVVATHDSSGIAYSLGNRADRRNAKFRGSPSKERRQWHKPGH